MSTAPAVNNRKSLRLETLGNLKMAPICIGEDDDPRRTYIDNRGVVVTVEWREREGTEEMLVQRFPAERLTNLIWDSFGAGFNGARN